MKSVVITVMVAGEGDTGRVSHSVLIDGEPVQTAVGVVLAGEYPLVVTGGIENTTQMRELALRARQLSDGLLDRVIGLMLSALQPPASPSPAEPN